MNFKHSLLFSVNVAAPSLFYFSSSFNLKHHLNIFFWMIPVLRFQVKLPKGEHCTHNNKQFGG